MHKAFASSTSIYLGDTHIPNADSQAHIGIMCSTKGSAAATVGANITKARGKIYAMTHTGLHGGSGLSPEAMIYLWRVHIRPVLTYGLQIVIPGTSAMVTLERFQLKVLKQMLGLPLTAASPSLYLISGLLPLEASIHMDALRMLGAIARSPGSVEFELMVRQSAVKDPPSRSWFVRSRALLAIYNLPSIYEVIEYPGTKWSWKKRVEEAVGQYWEDRINSQASLYRLLCFMRDDCLRHGVLHPCIRFVSPSTTDT